MSGVFKFYNLNSQNEFSVVKISVFCKSISSEEEGRKRKGELRFIGLKSTIVSLG